MFVGVDLSSNQTSFDFGLASRQGCRTAYIKLGGDNIAQYVSGSYAARVDQAHAAGWPVGSYWITGGHNPVQAAQFFTAHLRAFGAPDYVVLDNESLDSGNTYSDAEAATWVTEVLKHFGGNPARILHYGSKSFMESHAWPQLLATGCMFLIADYNGTPLQNHVPSTIPANRVTAHQYADNGNIGGASPVDMNAFVDGALTFAKSAPTPIHLGDEEMKLIWTTNGTGWLFVPGKGFYALHNMQQYNLYKRLIKSTPDAPESYLPAELDIMNAVIAGPAYGRRV